MNDITIPTPCQCSTAPKLIFACSGAADVGEIHQLLLERLGPNRLPGGYRFVARIPRLASGKIDRRTLAEYTHDPS